MTAARCEGRRATRTPPIISPVSMTDRPMRAMRTERGTVVRGLMTRATISGRGASVAQAQVPECSDLGSGHPRLAPGTYSVKQPDPAQSAHLYDTDLSGNERMFGAASWDSTKGMAVHQGGLNIISEGKLHRVNPETGDWYPKPLVAGAACDWYLGWPGPIWSERGSLYAIRTVNSATGAQEIQRIDFDRATSTNEISYQAREVVVR